MNIQRRGHQVFIKSQIILKKDPMCGSIAQRSKYFNHTSEHRSTYHLHFHCWSRVTIFFMQVNYSIHNQWYPNYKFWGFNAVCVCESVYVCVSLKILNNFICRHLLYLTAWDSLGLTGWDMTSLGMNALMYNVRDFQNGLFVYFSDDIAIKLIRSFFPLYSVCRISAF